MKDRSSRTGKELGGSARWADGVFWLYLLGGLCIAADVVLISGWLASEIFKDGTPAVDTRIREAIHQMSSPMLTTAMIALSFVGSPAFLLCLGFLVLGLF